MILSTKKGVKFSLSDGNKKIGMVCSFSVMPGPSCPPDIPCYKTCFAVKMIRQSGNPSWIGVKKSWAMNTAPSWRIPPGSPPSLLILSARNFSGGMLAGILAFRDTGKWLAGLLNCGRMCNFSPILNFSIFSNWIARIILT